jgi:putative glutamine amidotransferase
MQPRGRRPVIGVTGPNRGGGAAWLFTRLAVFMAGGHAVRITPRRPRPVEQLDGLIVGGGADVHPKLYGQDPTPIVEREKRPEQTLTEYLLGWVLFPLTFLLRKLAGQSAVRGGDAARDGLEMKLIDGAVRRGMPVLGICRGNQLLNVYFGGSLHQDLEGFYVEDPETRTILPRKRVVVTPASHLAKALACDPCTDGSVRVNALHRQAIHRTGEGVLAAARDRNGIVQAIEHESLPFVVGVQWHPEYLPQVPGQRALFKTLVREAKRVRERLLALDVPSDALHELPDVRVQRQQRREEFVPRG